MSGGQLALRLRRGRLGHHVLADLGRQDLVVEPGHAQGDRVLVGGAEVRDVEQVPRLDDPAGSGWVGVVRDDGDLPGAGAVTRAAGLGVDDLGVDDGEVTEADGEVPR